MVLPIAYDENGNIIRRSKKDLEKKIKELEGKLTELSDNIATKNKTKAEQDEKLEQLRQNRRRILTGVGSRSYPRVTMPPRRAVPNTIRPTFRSDPRIVNPHPPSYYEKLQSTTPPRKPVKKIKKPLFKKLMVKLNLAKEIKHE